MRTAFSLLLISFGLAFLLFVKINSDTLIRDYKFIGSERCKACHSVNFRGNQFGIWKESAHSASMKILSGDKARDYAKKKGLPEPLKNDACLKCHSSGYGMELKYFETSFDMSEGIQCEECHKPGNEYSKYQNMISYDKFKSNGGEKGNLKDCYRCHSYDVKNDKLFKCPFQNKNFNFESAFKLIKHSISK
jgi:cytochrome c peroxidase